MEIIYLNSFINTNEIKDSFIIQSFIESSEINTLVSMDSLLTKQKILDSIIQLIEIEE